MVANLWACVEDIEYRVGSIETRWFLLVPPTVTREPAPATHFDAQALEDDRAR